MKRKIKRPTKKSNSIGKLLRVEWEDHYTASGWSNPTPVDAVKVSTVGFVHAETPTMLLLAQQKDVSGFKGNFSGIIKKCILSRKEIK